MKPAAFDYVRPATLEQALDALQGDDATLVAGGQSLLPMLNLRIAMAQTLVDITRVPELRRTAEDKTSVFIGATTTHAMIEDGLGHDRFRGLLQRVASKIAYRSVRNMGTIGGSLALSDPAADWPACLLALDATACVAATSGERRIALDEFLLDAFETALEPDEILLGVDLPAPRMAGWGVGKVARKSGAFADSLAVAVLSAGERPTRIALSGTETCARLLLRTSGLVDEMPGEDEAQLAEVAAADIDEIHENATLYQKRCHIQTVLTAVSEARRWSR